MRNLFSKASDEEEPAIEVDPHGRPTVLLTLIPLLLAQLAAFYFYASGFVGSPVPHQSHNATVQVGPTAPVYDRVVVMLVDALRHDFVTAENFPYLSR